MVRQNGFPDETERDSGTLTWRRGSPGGGATPGLFISYRREDCPGHAGRLFDHLRGRFGEASVFMDVTDIEAGADFVEVLKRAVVSCDALLAVLGREWLTCEDRNGRRRLDNPHDFIRLEIGTALARNVRVIPVLVEGAVMPSASELPPDLEELTRRQAVELRDSRWIDDIESLTTVLDRLLDPSGPGKDGRESIENLPRRSRFRAGAAAVLVAALATAAWLVPRGEWMSFAPATRTASDTPTVEAQRAAVQLNTLSKLPNAERPTPTDQRPLPNAQCPLPILLRRRRQPPAPEGRVLVSPATSQAPRAQRAAW